MPAGNYGPPSGFNWEWGSQDEPFVDHPGWEENNVNKVVQNFVTQCMSLAAVTRGNDIMLTMGTDFTYANAFLWCALLGCRQDCATAVWATCFLRPCQRMCPPQPHAACLADACAHADR